VAILEMHAVGKLIEPVQAFDQEMQAPLAVVDVEVKQ